MVLITRSQLKVCLHHVTSEKREKGWGHHFTKFLGAVRTYNYHAIEIIFLFFEIYNRLREEDREMPPFSSCGNFEEFFAFFP